MKTKMSLSRAWPLANKIQTELESACKRIEKAGRVRRASPKDDVEDIEFVIIPRLCPELPAQISLFDEPPTLVSALDLLLEKMVRDKDNFRRGDKNGPSLKSFLIQFDEDGSELGLELWITTPEKWAEITVAIAAVVTALIVCTTQLVSLTAAIAHLISGPSNKPMTGLV